MSVILATALGGRLTKTALMDLAQRISAQKGIKIDRCARRIKDGLICWFCENAQRIVQQPVPDYGEQISDFDFPPPWGGDGPLQGRELDFEI
jgi:hypothetical protein